MDVLDWIPEGNPARAKLIGVVQKLMPAVVKYQDQETGLWWQVMDKGPQGTMTKGADGKPVYRVTFRRGRGISGGLG